MNINHKIMVLIAAALVLTAGGIGLIAVWQTRESGRHSIARLEHLERQNIERIRLEGEEEIEAFRRDYLAGKRAYLEALVDTAYSAVERALKDAQEMNETSVLDERVKEAVLLEQQDSIAEFVGALRYGPEGKDYFWINDMEPRMVMHPYKPELNGKGLGDIEDPNGKKLFVEFVRVCREQGQGFVDYMWPKYGAEEPQPKLSFVKHFPEWDWIIGSGIYMDEVESLVEARRAVIQERVRQTEEASKSLLEQTRQETQEGIRRVITLILLTALGAILLMLGSAYYFTRHSITRPVDRMIEGLTRSADEVSRASGQISFASQSLAEGASEQAASIEETSSSLEEMAAMTRQNADNAAEADRIMRETRETVETANSSMTELTGSMDVINESSAETSKIVKTIDEIAFQTNLLALNAAVEAARAGEAGAGFAVVADEVRNLAMRAAEAARNTSDLIEDTARKVKDGSGLLARTNGDFQKVSDSAGKVAELVSEISAASSEQAQGIDQLNRAVAEMDKVVQQNASQAEESASASEEMSAQSGQLKGIIGELATLTRGGAADRSTGGRRDMADVSRRGTRQRMIESGLQKGTHALEPGSDLTKDRDFQNF